MPEGVVRLHRLRFAELQLLLDILFTPFRFEFFDKRLFRAPVKAVIFFRFFLVISRDFHPQMAASRMNDEIELPLFVFVHLDKVVAPAERAKRQIAFRQADAFLTNQIL